MSAKKNQTGNKRSNRDYTVGKNMKGQTVHTYKKGNKYEHVVVKPKKAAKQGTWGSQKRDGFGRFSK